MFANATSSLLQPHFSFINSSFVISCLLSRPHSFVFITYNVAYFLLLLPLSIFILHHGFQQCRKKSSSSSSSAAVSHSDIFTYHMVVMEMVSIFGCALGSGGILTEDSVVVASGVLLFNFTWFGKLALHVLTSVERHLAVVHPVTYMRLRNERGVRIRNAAVLGSWLFCFGGISVMATSEYGVLTLCLMVLSLAVISFCSVSVLRVLVRPGPGGERAERGDWSKRRAFCTIVAILAVLAVRVVWNMVWMALFLWGGDLGCAFMACEAWLNLPNGLVLPLLYLHRARRMAA